MLDVYIALGLTGVAISMFFGVRLGVLPKKTLPFILAAVVGAIGISIFRASRVKSLEHDIRRRERALKKRNTKLEQMRRDLNLSEKDYNKAVAIIDKELEAGKKRILLINENRQKERMRISKLIGAELDREFETVMRSLND